MNPLFLSIAVLVPQGSAAAPPAAEPPRSRLELRVSPLVDLAYWLRALAVDGGPVPEKAGVPEAVAATAELHRELGGLLAWGPVDAALAECASAAELVESAARMPERLTLAGREIELRAKALAMARAALPIEGWYREAIWPRHSEAIELAREAIERELLSREEECLAYMLEHLAMEDPDTAVEVFLVARSPAPHGITHRIRGGGVCFVGLDGPKGTQLLEMILHEATHALDVATAEGGSVLEDLRSMLAEAGVGPRDRAMRDVPHTLMFVHAAETVRRLIDPEHVPYGDVHGYYDKVRAVADVEIAAWRRYLDGEIRREEALEGIVERCSPKK